MEFVFASFLVLLCLVDRFVLKRREIKIDNLYYAGFDDDLCKFVISFRVLQELRGSSISFQLSDTNDPTNVVSGVSRELSFSKVGGNRQYLCFPKKFISSGDWVLDVEVSSFGSRINPSYKLFPISSRYKRAFHINVNGEGNVSN